MEDKAEERKEQRNFKKTSENNKQTAIVSLYLSIIITLSVKI